MNATAKDHASSLDLPDRLATTALIVSLIALFVSAWQLAQTLFATAADGKRFCQRSVMGPWARKTRLSWRWSQIRYETKYTTPDISMSYAIPKELIRNKSYEADKATRKKRRWKYRLPVVRILTTILNGPASDFEGWFSLSDFEHVPWELAMTLHSRVTMNPIGGTRAIQGSATERISFWLIRLWLWLNPYNEDNADSVTWLRFLRAVYQTQSRSSGATKNTGFVAIRLTERSWDLAFPDVVRPLAVSSVGSIVVIAHRLGMQRKDDFSPSDGKMNAAGCGHEMSSDLVR